MQKLIKLELEKLFYKYFNYQNQQRKDAAYGCIYRPGNYEIKEIDFDKEIIHYIFEQYKEATSLPNGYYFTNQISFRVLKEKVSQMHQIPKIKFHN